MKDRILGIAFFGVTLLLCCAIAVSLVLGLIEWIQTGRWHSMSLLQAGYEAHLLRASWFLSTDWGWHLHEVLDRIPLLLAAAVLAPISWRIGAGLVRR